MRSTSSIRSSGARPGETWFWDYSRQQDFGGPELAPPRHHPLDQPTPGPAGRVPPDWHRQLH